MFREKFLSVSKTLRYCTVGNTDIKQLDELIFVFHGYGQLVEFFSKKFEDLHFDNKLFVFPEGLHRFYIDGTSGRVGASWMTKELRERDIEENNHALEKLLDFFSKEYTWKQFSVLGFSQGGATASRWISKSKTSCNKYISWASVFPPDLELTNFETVTQERFFVLGDNDPYFKAENSDEILDFYRKFNFEIITYKGQHSIDQEILKQLFK